MRAMPHAAFSAQRYKRFTGVAAHKIDATEYFVCNGHKLTQKQNKIYSCDILSHLIPPSYLLRVQDLNFASHYITR